MVLRILSCLETAHKVLNNLKLVLKFGKLRFEWNFRVLRQKLTFRIENRTILSV